MKDAIRGVNADTLRWIQFGLVLGSATLLGLAYWLIPPFHAEADRSLAVLGSGDLERLRDYIQSFGNWAPVASLVLMVLQALAAPVPSFLITFANGLAFGVFWGWLLSVTGHALAASVCFWLARALGRRPVELLTGRVGLEAVDGWISRRGAVAILLARLIPGMAFDAVSYGVGLTGMRYGRFIAATVVGTMPQTLLYAYLGREAPQYAWTLFLASGLMIAATAAFSLYRWRKEHSGSASQPDIDAAPRTGSVRLRAAVQEQATWGE